MNLYHAILAQAAAAAPAAKTTAAAQQAQPGAMDGLLGFMPMIVIIAVMFYLMYRGQKKEQKRRQEMLESIRKGSDVVTVGGICGRIAEVAEDNFVLEIAPNVKITVTKNAVASVKGDKQEAVKK